MNMQTDRTSIATTTATAVDIRRILQMIPHRYPMLMVDKVVDMQLDHSAVGIKNVSINEPFFQGHFPGYPVMPGVMIIEALAQVSVILVYQTLGRRPDGKSLIFFAGIDNARFKRQVLPGDQLVLQSTEIRLLRGVGKFAVRATVGDALVAEAELLAALREL
jgi:3-hydroxyacyl-[acyl-carrier-protein] dehydratase